MPISARKGHMGCAKGYDHGDHRRFDRRWDYLCDVENLAKVCTLRSLARNLKHMPVVQSDCRELPAPHTSTIESDHIILHVQA